MNSVIVSIWLTSSQNNFHIIIRFPDILSDLLAKISDFFRMDLGACFACGCNSAMMPCNCRPTTNMNPGGATTRAHPFFGMPSNGCPIVAAPTNQIFFGPSHDGYCRPTGMMLHCQYCHHEGGVLHNPSKAGIENLQESCTILNSLGRRR